ncbi:zeta toxin family protein [Pseudomonas entomophila]|uniref:zeta toxin family protein n=1 Tax=Pseudomonas entomophila TaxID=312306 RepID=UPI001BD08626|nr:zeta toxin family protein [Pseudomonas entomophila]QVM89591.1 zeta toxin family protein [Pseudomonas entomophila]
MARLTSVPRLRVFAGPNGSGKSTIKADLPAALTRLFVNADDLEQEAKSTGFIDLAPFDVATSLPELLRFHTEHYLIQTKQLTDQAEQLTLLGSKVDYRAVRVDSYFASVIADFIRQHLLDTNQSFTFESVMSHPSKIEFMRQAQARGYRTYLYFVSTENPQINIERVAIRVRAGGHPVRDDLVRSRYDRSLDLLPDAIAASHRAYVFDNSGQCAVWLAEITAGTQLEFRNEEVPDWFFESYVDQVEP